MKHHLIRLTLLTGVTSIVTGCLHTLPQPPVRYASVERQPACIILATYTPQDRATFGPPLSYAASSGDLGSADCLLKAGNDADATNPQGVTPLIAAIKKGDSEMVRLLLHHRASPNKSSNGITPLEAAYTKRNQTVIGLLKHAGASTRH